MASPVSTVGGTNGHEIGEHYPVPEGSSPQPGWYADPSSSRGWRYWDGLSWTEHRSGERRAQAAPLRRPDASKTGSGVRKPPVVRWLRSNWKWGLAGFLGLGMGAAVAAGEAPKSRTVVENHTVTQTHTQVVTVRKPPKIKTKTVTVTAQTPAPAPAPAATPGPSTGAGSDYSGSGEKNVGTISVPVDSVLKWHATGGFFTIY